MSKPIKFNRYGVRQFRSSLWHIIGPDGELVWDRAGYGHDKPLMFDNEDAALACAARMSDAVEDAL